MAFVIWVDPAFQYRDNYIAYILRRFDKRFAEGLIADGVEWASKNDLIMLHSVPGGVSDRSGECGCVLSWSCRKDASMSSVRRNLFGRFKAES